MMYPQPWVHLIVSEDSQETLWLDSWLGGDFGSDPLLPCYSSEMISMERNLTLFPKERF